MDFTNNQLFSCGLSKAALYWPEVRGSLFGGHWQLLFSYKMLRKGHLDIVLKV